MRTWYVPLNILDTQRLLGQHREIHALLGSITSPRGGYLNHPVTKLYNGPHLECLIDYHQQVVSEFHNRDWHGHQTPVQNELAELAESLRTSETCGNWDSHVLYMEEPALHEDMHDLIERWLAEGKDLVDRDAFKWARWHQGVCPSGTCIMSAQQLMEESMKRGGYEPRTIDHPLVGKLRTLSSLQDNPELAELVINDMMYWYFIREKKRPQALFRLMMSANFKWKMALGIPPGAEDEAAIEAAKELEDASSGTSGES